MYRLVIHCIVTTLYYLVYHCIAAALYRLVYNCIVLFQADGRGVHVPLHVCASSSEPSRHCS